MFRRIIFTTCLLAPVLALAPTLRSSESSSNKSYTSGDEPQNLDFPFSGQGPEANDIHITFKQNVQVQGAKAYPAGVHPPGEGGETEEKGTTWNVDKGNGKTEMTLSKVKKGPNLQAGGNLRLQIDPTETEFSELVESYRWTLDKKPIGEEQKVSSIGGSGAAGAAKVATAGGLRTVTFDTLEGRVIVNLPDDMRAGDTISGTVVAEPKGQAEEERTKHMAAMGVRRVKVATAAKADGTSDLNVDVPVTATTRAFTFKLPPASTPSPAPPNVSSSKSGALGITLTHISGPLSTGPTQTIPIEIVSLSLQSAAPVTVHQLPTLGQQGRPIEIPGPFDGDSANTSLHWLRPRSTVPDFEKNTENVSGGFGLIDGKPIAESPRKAVFIAPTNVTGPVEITLKEGNKETKGTYRNVGAKLTAPKTTLSSRERTTLTIDISGLQGIKEPVPLTLIARGVITMRGGNVQKLVIQPSQVRADGRYIATRDVTGDKAGVWSATVTVVTLRPVAPAALGKATVVFVDILDDAVVIRFPDGTTVTNSNGAERVEKDGKTIADRRFDGRDLGPRPDGTERDKWPEPVNDPKWLEYLESVAVRAEEKVKGWEIAAENERRQAEEARKRGDEEEARLCDARARAAEAEAEARRILAQRERRRADAERKRQGGGEQGDWITTKARVSLGANVFAREDRGVGRQHNIVEAVGHEFVNRPS